jgi:hypothetical protein
MSLSSGSGVREARRRHCRRERPPAAPLHAALRGLRAHACRPARGRAAAAPWRLLRRAAGAAPPPVRAPLPPEKPCPPDDGHVCAIRELVQAF